MLKEKLNAYQAESLKRTNQDNQQIMQNAAQALIDQKIGAQALKKGDIMPSFNLINAKGQKVSSQELLSQGPVIINFYRGAWCPYCNLELRAYQALLPEIKQAKATLVAISPELPDTSLSLVEKHQLDFEVLTDLDNELAKKMGLVFQLDKKLIEVYTKAGHDIAKAQGNDRFELPLPATYVVNSDGKILLAYVNTDYRQRLEPSLALKAILEVKKDES